MLLISGKKLYDNPQKFGIDNLFKTMEDWIEYAVLSKRYVDFNEIKKNPQEFLTHSDDNIPFDEMVNRLYSNRKLAQTLVSQMISNLENKFNNLPSYLISREKQVLDWYEKKGWELLLY